jgi:hypothetical protein
MASTKTDKPKQKTPGYPLYPAKDDIYNVGEERVHYPDPDEEGGDTVRDKSIEDGLDVPGSELDDEMELIGDEDEENNYYSLGGDDHNDLEEDHAADQ